VTKKGRDVEININVTNMNQLDFLANVCLNVTYYKSWNNISPTHVVTKATSLFFCDASSRNPLE